MRTRNHEIKIRLNDREYEKLQKQVAKTHFTRETFLRLLLQGNVIQECPKDYIDFIAPMRHIATDLQILNRFGELSESDRKALAELTKKLWELIAMLEDIYFPYYKLKRENVQQFWLTKEPENEKK